MSRGFFLSWLLSFFTRSANDFVIAKSHARKKPLLVARVENNNHGHNFLNPNIMVEIYFWLIIVY